MLTQSLVSISLPTESTLREGFDLDYMNVTVLDTSTVMVEVIEGVEIDKEKALIATMKILEMMPGDYGMIVHRKEPYSIVPLEVYEVLNSIEPLKAIAIVLTRSRSFLPMDTEKRLFRRPLEIFRSIEEAQAWLAEQVGSTD